LLLLLLSFLGAVCVCWPYHYIELELVELVLLVELELFGELVLLEALIGVMLMLDDGSLIT